MLTAKRDKAAAMRFFDKAMKANSVPEKVTMDKSGANKAAIDEINARGQMPIIVRQVKYLNNIFEQGHRAIKRVTKLMLNFKQRSSAGNATEPFTQLDQTVRQMPMPCWAAKQPTRVARTELKSKKKKLR